MPVIRKWVAQECEDNQWLRIDHPDRYIFNDSNDWQPLFGPNSSISTPARVIKIAGELDVNDLSSIRLAAYLYNPATGGVENASACTFSIYKVAGPGHWTDTLVYSTSGTIGPNQYFFVDIPQTAMSSITFDGSDTIMIEATITRLSEQFRDRVYINHLGIYDNVLRLRQDVDFIDITKLDE